MKQEYFLTLTTDPALWMRPKGEEFIRHIRTEGDKHSYHFNAVGKGLSLIAANRHESTAWRKWYEAECYRRDYRVPYIRVVEFQKNGLIHTHILLFGISWDTSWHEFAKDWGEKYGQGFTNKAYRIVNKDHRWEWADAEFKPVDTKGRNPSDYLMKYLKKAQHLPQVTCPKCKHVMYSAGETICPECKTRIKPAYDGRFMYWVCGKRFFTVSNSLRTPDFDAEIARDDKKREKETRGPLYEFVGAVDETLLDNLITKDRIKHTPPFRPLRPAHTAEIPSEFKKDWQFEDEFKPSEFVPWEESPDTNDDIPKIPEPDEISEYEKMLREESRRMVEHRSHLKRTSEERSG